MARLVNCRGLGARGTSALAVEGETTDPTARERVRLPVAPHDPADGLRTPCRARVLGDVTARRCPGVRGQHVDASGADGGDG